MRDDEEPTIWSDAAGQRPPFERAPEWEPFLAGPIYDLLAHDLAVEEEIDRVLAYLGLA